jgi:hypothetical protein
MALEGTLKDFGLPDIFQLIGLQRKTGVLTLRAADETVHVYFLDGKIVSADSESRRLEDRLGTVLVRRGLLTQAQLHEVLEKQRKTLQRLGHILVSDRYVGRDEMRQALTAQIQQILYRLFRWKDGDYNFSQEATIDYDKENFVPIPPESILMEGMQMVDEWPIIEKKIRSFDMVFEKVPLSVEISVKEPEEGEDLDAALDEGLGLVEAHREAEAGVHLTREEMEIYRLVDGRLTVREITYRSRLNEFSTCKTLYDLLSRNLIQEAGKAAARPAHAAAAPVAARPRAESHPVVRVVGYLVILALTVVSVANLHRPPWNLDAWLPLPTLLVDASRTRMERIDYSLQLYRLYRGSFPAELGSLAQEGLLSERDILDPWGQRYEYEPEEGGGYLLLGRDGQGQGLPELLIRRTGDGP